MMIPSDLHIACGVGTEALPASMLEIPCMRGGLERNQDGETLL